MPSCRSSPDGARPAPAERRGDTPRDCRASRQVTTPGRPTGPTSTSSTSTRSGSERRDALQAFLKEREIGSAVYYPLPLHLQPCFAHLGYERGRLPVTEAATDQVLSLPIYPELSRAQQDWVIESIRAFYA